MKASPQIAIVGMACLYPDADSPQELWENVLSQRRAFRRFPSERLSLSDYYSPDKSAPDVIYSTQAAVIEGYEFDRIAYKVVGSTFRSADLAHWLALDIASQALNDAGFPDGKGLNKETTGVLLGNTLTGELSRANTLRLRWPYVRHRVEEQLLKQGLSDKERQIFLNELENRFKEPFEPIGEESLAGNLANTIAGRICNYFDLKGGGYIVDGACSSSLLAVANGCSALVAEDLDIALVGGVDISMDPFELVGFAKTGALASGEMKVYDQGSNGFIPGEGCGFLVLMRHGDALAQNKRIYAVIQGWGISSDGKGGITRPEVEGQLFALNRAYKRAEFTGDTIAYFEGHGTGTAVGDGTELEVLSRIHPDTVNKAVIGSIKANIGHTKAAAGIAGLIKATMAVHRQILPPVTGCDRPQARLTEDKARLQVLKEGQIWPNSLPLRAGVSAMGFGGINSHIIIEGLSQIRRHTLTPQEQKLIHSPQDAELFLLSANSQEDLQAQVNRLLNIVPRISQSEMTDLAVELAKKVNPHLPYRLAIIASSPDSLTNHLVGAQGLRSLIPPGQNLDNIFTNNEKQINKIGFLFPGQSAPVYLHGGLWERRFPVIKQLYNKAQLAKGKDNTVTNIAQPAIITACLGGLQLLENLNIKADLAIGHSLGELCALFWANAYDKTQLINLAKIRGQAMAQLGHPTGRMASINADAETVKSLLNGRIVEIAGLNSPYQTIISGEALGIKDVVEKAQNKGIKTVYLPVSHAFHSPLVAPAVQPLEDYLQTYPLNSLQKTVISTVTGEKLPLNTDWRSLLLEQITSPVRFIDAVKSAEKEVDLFIEVGSGSILSRLVADITDIPVISLDSSSESLQGLLKTVAVMFVNGVKVNYQGLFEDRFSRPFNLDYQPHFIGNPCEIKARGKSQQAKVENIDLFLPNHSQNLKPETSNLKPETSKIEVIRQLVAQKTELPLETIENHHRLLADLHLNSISVSQLVIEAARQLDLSPPHSPTDYANATIQDLAAALEELGKNNPQIPQESIPMGVDNWVRAFTVELIEKPLIKSDKKQINREKAGNWHIIAHADHPLLPNLSVLQPTLKHEQEKGIIICLKPHPDESEIDLLLKGAKLSIKEKKPLILIQQGGGYASFARTFYLENRQIPTCVIDIPFHHPNAVNIILSEITATDSYTEVYYDENGKRFLRQLNLLGLEKDTDNPKQKKALKRSNKSKIKELLLVTGGGRGIASECALSLAKENKATLAILGRSQPEDNRELAENLARMKSANIQVHYYSCDVSDAESVQQTIAEIKTNLGEITGILHGAGVNTPKLIQHLEPEDFIATLAPKVKGLQHILTEINPDSLNYLITFGSIIAETGLKGEADYGLANEWLGDIVGEFSRKYPNCRCLNLEWSVWSGIGMGERLGTVEKLRNEGITPISPDIGIKYLHLLLNQSLPTASVIIAGRFGEPPTLSLKPQELSFLRFLETKKVHYTGIELITEAELSLDNDPYLQDHVYQGEYIFPGVLGLEAIAQVATALLPTLARKEDQTLNKGENQDPPSVPLNKGETGGLRFESVKFNRPIVVSADQPLKIQIATLITDSGKVKAVIRCANTGFSIDHFEAIISHSSVGAPDCRPLIPPVPLKEGKNNPQINPDKDLYGHLLFHKARFQRIKGYSHLKATECIAEIKIEQKTAWFSRYLPQSLILGDAGARDAVIHALQACVPHATILPTGIERLTVYSVNLGENQFVSAKERLHQGDTFVYDLEVLDDDGNLLEVWQGLELKVIKHRNPQDPWIPALLPCYLERKIKEVMPNVDLTLILDRDATVERRVRSDRSLGMLTSSPSVIQRRGDGKPELSDNEAVSVSHAEDLTLVLKGASGCDLEPIIPRDVQMWRDLLGENSFNLAEVISQENHEDFNMAATRIWSAKESIKKAGLSLDIPLTLSSFSQQLTPLSPILWLSSGKDLIITLPVSFREIKTAFILAIFVQTVPEKSDLLQTEPLKVF